MTAAAVAVWIALGAQPAQSPPPPTGLIVGRVVDAPSGRPVAGAIVSLNGTGIRAAGPTDSARQPRAMTNGSGQFVFRRLAKGAYQLAATRPGYVDGAYGRREPGGTSAVLQLDEAQRVGDVVIPMWRHAAIGGTVTDETGEPLIGVQVSAFPRRFVAGRQRIVQGPQATTDDRGIYRIASLAPGDYLVAFVARQTSVPLATSELMRSMNTSDPKMQAILNERFSLGGGLVAGTGSPSTIQIGGSVADLSSSGATPPPAADERALFVYGTQFFPGLPSPARAAVLTLASGQERGDVDFSLRPIRTYRVSGTLVGPEGPLSNATVRLVPTGDDAMIELDTSATMTGGGGEFALLGVPPGQYSLKVTRIPRPATPPSSTTTMTQIQMGSSMVMTSMSGNANPATPPPVPDDPTLFADLPVAVGNADVADVLVTLQRGARVTGRIEFDGTRERPDATALTRITIALDRADAMTSTTPAGPPPSGRPDETGAFKTYGVPAGRYVVRVSGPSGWTLKSVTSEGRDISETPIDLRNTDVANAVITFTDRPTKLTGVARSADGNADADAVVLVFPADSAGWSDYGPSPRRVRSAHAAKDGTYSFEGLPAGEYHVAAIREDATPDWRDMRVLEDLARGAPQVRLGDGETRAQDVKTVKGGGQ